MRAHVVLGALFTRTSRLLGYPGLDGSRFYLSTQATVAIDHVTKHGPPSLRPGPCDWGNPPVERDGMVSKNGIFLLRLSAKGHVRERVRI